MTTHSLTKSCAKVREFLNNSERLVVIHHWDSDGVASASIIDRSYHRDREIYYVVPRIGDYDPKSSIDIEYIKSLEPDLVLILDYGIPAQEVMNISKTLEKPIAVIDHHVNECLDELMCNPLAYGLSEDNYPSTTLVLRNLIGIENSDDLVLLGIIGDIGWKYRETPLSKWIDSRCRDLGIEIDDLFRVSRIIGSCYRLFRLQELSRLRYELSRYGVKYIAQSNAYNHVIEDLDREVRRALEGVKVLVDRGNLKVFELESNYYITSLVGRHLAKQFRNSTVVLINYVRSLGRSYAYIRSWSKDLSKLIPKLRAQGFLVGGKNYVLVITCNSAKCNEIDRVLKFIDNM